MYFPIQFVFKYFQHVFPQNKKVQGSIKQGANPVIVVHGEEPLQHFKLTGMGKIQ
jgi:hypothetical protein